MSTKKTKSALKEKQSFNVSDSTPLTKEKKLSPKKENSKENKNSNNPFITLIEKLLYCNDLFAEDYSEIKPKITDYPKISENIRYIYLENLYFFNKFYIYIYIHYVFLGLKMKMKRKFSKL